MGNPFKINGGPIQKTRGILSKSTGTAKALQFQTFHRSAAKHPPNRHSQPPCPSAGLSGTRCPSRAFESGSLCTQEERLCGSPGGSRGPHWGNPCPLPPRRGKRSALPKGDVPSRAAVEELSQPTGRLPPAQILKVQILQVQNLKVQILKVQILKVQILKVQNLKVQISKVQILKVQILNLSLGWSLWCANQQNSCFTRVWARFCVARKSKPL